MIAMPTFERPIFDAITVWGMGFLALGMSLAWTRFAARHHRRYSYAFAAVFIAIAGIAWLGDRSGVFARTDLLPSPFVLAV